MGLASHEHHLRHRRHRSPHEPEAGDLEPGESAMTAVCQIWLDKCTTFRRALGPDISRQTAPVSSISQEQAAIRTLKVLGYTYTEGAQMWKPAGALALLLHDKNNQSQAAQKVR